MNNKMRAIMVALLPVLVTGVASAAPPSDAALRDATAAYLRGNYTAAARALEDSADPEARRTLAGLYVMLGRYREAEALYRSMPQEHGRLAAVLQLQGRHTEAEPMLRRSCDALQRKYGIDHAEVADCIARLGELAYLQGRLAEAERRYWQAYQVQVYLYGEYGSAVGRTLTGLGRVAAAGGDRERARGLYARALAIAERPARTNEWGRLDERDLRQLYAAEREHSAVRGQIVTRSRESEHPEFARHFDHLAELYAALGRRSDAESMLRRSIAIREKAFGPGHPEVAKSLSSLKQLY
jgi:tetratricopeptide (TPR) repeat protein